MWLNRHVAVRDPYMKRQTGRTTMQVPVCTPWQLWHSWLNITRIVLGSSFIFGELIDTYQNQKIPHIEHIKMALHARFFIDMWQSFLKATGYSKTCYFISHKFADILGFLMDGLISLVVIHWDHMGGEIYPLLPWLHSSETCKHIFGECQKLIKDFTFLNFSI
jgi:hypothetical protein